MLLVLPIMAAAQGFEVGTTERTSIYASPGGRVVMTLPKCGECTAFAFLVVESRKGWLKIRKASFRPADSIMQGDEEVNNDKYLSLNRISGECWVRARETFTMYAQPGTFVCGDKFYVAPSKKSRCAGTMTPTVVLEIRGNWVKVEGNPGTYNREFEYWDFNSLKTVSGWMYMPNLEVSMCGA